MSQSVMKLFVSIDCNLLDHKTTSGIDRIYLSALRNLKYHIQYSGILILGLKMDRRLNIKCVLLLVSIISSRADEFSV